MIDADEIVKVAEHAYNEWNLAMVGAETNRKVDLVYKRQELCKAIKAVADSMPTVDAVRVVHGRLDKQEYIHGTRFTCSECGCKCTPPYHYCPNCGAIFDEEDTH
jgi:hypothetical protein